MNGVMNVQSLNEIVTQLEMSLFSNPSRSLSGVFKAMRRLDKIDQIGDFPLFWFILNYGADRTPCYNWNEFQVRHALKLTDFYTNRMAMPQEFKVFIVSK